MTLMKRYTIFGSARQAKPSLFIPIQSHSLAPTLFYCIRTTTFQRLHAAVIEPLSSAWPVFATVNSWNPLACVGVDWSHCCVPTMPCLQFLRVCPVWFNGNELECSVRCSDAESEVCEYDLVKVAVRGHVGVHGGLSDCSRPQELSSAFVIHEQLLPHIELWALQALSTY